MLNSHFTVYFKIVEFSETAANEGKIVIMSALNGTWQKRGWENILELIPLCEKVKKLSAICKICSMNANFTFRTCSGSSQEMIGGSEIYMPLCRECYNEKSKQQILAKNIIHSECRSGSTNLNDSNEGSIDGSNSTPSIYKTLDMKQMDLTDSTSSQKMKPSPLSLDGDENEILKLKDEQ